MFVLHAAKAGGRCPASPNVRKKLEMNNIPAHRKSATETPPAVPLLLKTIPSGAANNIVTKQITGWAKR